MISWVAIAVSLAACGGSSDISDISTAAIQKTDLPSGFKLNSPDIVDSWSAYSDPAATNFGQLGTNCGASPETGEQQGFQQGLVQTALESNGLGVLECAQTQSSENEAKQIFSSGQIVTGKSKDFKPAHVDTIGDQTLAGSITQSGAVVHLIVWRRGKTLIALTYLDTMDGVSLHRLYTIAKSIDVRLK